MVQRELFELNEYLKDSDFTCTWAAGVGLGPGGPKTTSDPNSETGRLILIQWRIFWLNQRGV